jgi:hypothetical protein
MAGDDDGARVLGRRSHVSLFHGKSNTALQGGKNGGSINPAAWSDDNGSGSDNDRTWSNDDRSWGNNDGTRDAARPVHTCGAVDYGARFRRRHCNEASN